MTDTLTKAEKEVSIINHGAGPMHTAKGVLNPGQSLSVPESLAKKLTGAYRHIRLASDIIPGQKDAEAAAAEAAALKAQIKELEGKLEGNEKAAAGRIAELTDLLGKFAGAENKKELDALRAKHADALPKKPE